jgi:mono/diheme cytochrome c family protein
MTIMRTPQGVFAAATLSMVFTIACGHDFEPPDRAQRVLEAERAYSAALFDSISWASQEVRVLEGNTVYAEECRRCHGQLGEGRTAYARERNLTVPSLVEPDWPLAERDALRREIYVGHESGMPVFGEGDLSLWQVDAVAAYILDVLRPEVRGDGQG